MTARKGTSSDAWLQAERGGESLGATASREARIEPQLTGFSAADVVARLEGQAPTLALFTTFTFSPSAFQEQYVRPLQRVGCERIVVLVDPLGYHQSLGEVAVADGAGTYYRVRRVASRGSFHGKLALLVGGARTVIGIGSGNLTAEGMRCNAEVGVLASFDGTEERARADEFAARLLSLASMVEVGERPARLAMGSDTTLLTSLDASILNDIQPPEGLDEIVITSPYVESLPRVVAALRGRNSSVRVRVRLDPKYGSLTRSLMRGLPPSTLLEVPRDSDDAGQPFQRPRVHGKSIVLRGATEALVLLGSANATAAGLLETSNFEAVVVHRTTRERAMSINATAGIGWRRATAGDATDPVPRDEHERSAGLVAELRDRTLRLAWAATLPQEGKLWLETTAGRRALGAIAGREGVPDTWIADVEVAADSAAGSRPGGVARLAFRDGRAAMGWIDVLAILESPPGLRQQARLLADLFERPEDTDDADVESILVLLRRDLEAPRAGRHATGRGEAAAATESTTEFDRLSLLDLDLSDGLERNGLQMVHGGLLHSAAKRLRELDLVENEGDKPDDSDDSAPKQDGRRRRSVPGLPRRVADAIGRLIDLLVERADVSRSRDDVRGLAVRIPTYVEAIEFVHRRYRLSRGWAQSLLLRAVSALTDPGITSSAARSGAIHRVLSIGSAPAMRPSPSASACLAALVLLLFPLESRADRARARDRIDLIGAALGPESRSATDDWLKSLHATCGSLQGAPDPTSASLEEIRLVDGEVASARAARDALHALVAALATNTSNQQERLALAGRAAAAGGAEALLTSLSQIHRAGRPLRLQELDLPAESVCPECQMQLPGAELSRLHNPQYVSRCTCGTLLTRRLA